MVKTLIQGIVVLALALGIAFGAAYFTREKPAAVTEGQTANTKDGKEAVPEKKPEKIVLPQPPTSVAERRNPDLVEQMRVPVSVEARFVAGAEETESVARGLAERNASLDRRELLLSERQEAMNLILEDFRSEQENVSKLRKTVDTELEAATKDLSEQAKLLDTPKTGNKSKTTAAAEGADEVASLKKVALVYDNMQADAAAKIFIQMCEDNLTDTVVKLLATMKDRQAAKTLAEIANTQAELASQLTDKLRKLKQGNATPDGAAADAQPGQ